MGVLLGLGCAHSLQARERHDLIDALEDSGLAERIALMVTKGYLDTLANPSDYGHVLDSICEMPPTRSS